MYYFQKSVSGSTKSKKQSIRSGSAITKEPKTPNKSKGKKQKSDKSVKNNTAESPSTKLKKGKPQTFVREYLHLNYS